MGRVVSQFDKEVSFRLETGVGYVTSICMGRAVRQFDKEVSFILGKGVEMLHRSVWDAPSASSIKKLVLVYKQEWDMFRTVWDAPSASSRKKLVLD